MRTWAVAIALALATIAVGIGAVAVSHQLAQDHHANSCRAMRTRIEQAYADPSETRPPTHLPAYITTQIVTDRDTWQHNNLTSTQPRIAQENDFAHYVTTEVPTLLALAGCP